MQRNPTIGPATGSARAGLLALLALLAAAPLPAQEAGGDTLSLTLEDAVAMALDRGRDAHAAEATRDAALFRDAAFNGRLLPRLSLEATAPAYNSSIIEVLQPDGSTLFRTQDQTTTALSATLSQRIPWTGGEFFVSSALTRLSLSGTQDELTYSSTPVNIGLRQPIFRPNTIRWDRREQDVRTQAADRRFLEEREGIARATAGLFFDVYAARVEWETARTNAAVNDTLYTLNTGRYEIGRIGENDLLQSELALLQARTNLDAATLALERALAALRIGLHLPPDAPLAVAAPEETPDFEPDTALAVREALRNSAAVSDVDLRQIQAERRVTEAKLDNGFGAVLSASYGFNATGDELSGAYENLLEAQRLNFSVEIPLMNWGVRGNEVGAARMERDAVEHETRVTLEETAHEARFAALQLSQARRSLELSTRADTVAQKRFEVAYNRYGIGRISIDNLFIAQREKDQARQRYVQALRGYWDAYYRLRQVTLYDFRRGERIGQ
ncbi:MAG: TolC family protein [Gemmatimonadota bacterium]